MWNRAGPESTDNQLGPGMNGRGSHDGRLSHGGCQGRVITAKSAIDRGFPSSNPPHGLTSRCAPPPRPEARNPSGDTNAESFVLGPKGCPKLRFFVSQDKQVKAQPDEHPILKKAGVAEKQALANDRRYDRDVHGVSYMPVESADHKMTRRKNGRRRTQPVEREPGKRVHEDGNARHDEKDSGDAKKGKAEKGRLNAPVRDVPWHETCNNSGGNEEKEHRSQDGERSPRSASPHAFQRGGH